MNKLNTPAKKEYPVLLEVWESSVRATHHFLHKGDVEIFKQIIIEKQVFDHVQLVCVRDQNNTILGFMGTSQENLEMLFIDAAARGRGLGKRLLLYAIEELNISKVDVNEQNEQAIRFYTHFGFKTISRSEVDGTGKPYPLLHMQLASF